MPGPGYRSPSRPIPNDLIPEIPSLGHTGTIDGSADIDQENLVPGGHESLIDGDSDDSWWHEAVKVADNVENMGDLFISSMVSFIIIHLVLVLLQQIFTL